MRGIGFQTNGVSGAGREWSPFPHLCPPQEKNPRPKILPAALLRLFKRILQGIFGLALSIPISLTALILLAAGRAEKLRERLYRLEQPDSLSAGLNPAASSKERTA